jgi:hypothetical protein
MKDRRVFVSTYSKSGKTTGRSIGNTVSKKFRAGNKSAIVEFQPADDASAMTFV